MYIFLPTKKHSRLCRQVVQVTHCAANSIESHWGSQDIIGWTYERVPKGKGNILPQRTIVEPALNYDHVAQQLLTFYKHTSTSHNRKSGTGFRTLRLRSGPKKKHLSTNQGYWCGRKSFRQTNRRFGYKLTSLCKERGVGITVLIEGMMVHKYNLKCHQAEATRLPFF